MKAPPRKTRWTDTDESREALAQLRRAMVGWKAGGIDVRELEAYLASPGITEEGLEQRLRPVITRVNMRNMRMRAGKSIPPECRRCHTQLLSTEKQCPECGLPVSGPVQACPSCPVCKSRLGPGDKKCQICGRRLKPWKLFG